MEGDDLQSGSTGLKVNDNCFAYDADHPPYEDEDYQGDVSDTLVSLMEDLRHRLLGKEREGKSG
jgi:hypothetical protein